MSWDYNNIICYIYLEVCYFEAIPANECPSDASNLPKCMVAWDDDCKLQNMIDGELCAHDLSVISPIIVQRYQDKNALGSKSCNGYNVLRYAGGTYIFQ